MKSFILIPAFTSLSILMGLGSCSKLKKNDLTRPDIVIIYTDDQGYGDVSALNPDSKIQTPNMDSLAAEGMVFTDGHSSDAVCTPSRYSLITGRYSWRTTLKRGVAGADGRCLIPDSRMTIAGLLKQHGYNTAMIGKWHLLMDFPGTIGHRDWSQPITDGPTEKGFDYFFGIPASMNFGVLTYIENDRVLEIPDMWTHRKILEESPYRDFRFDPPYDSTMQHDYDIEVAPSFHDYEVLEHLQKKAVEQINLLAKKDQPFFLYIALTSPHLPHAVHPDFRGKSQCGKYGDFIMETDYRVGEILKALDDNGIRENTLVVFTSDNGPETNYEYQQEAFGHHSNYIFKGGKRDIYEGGHREPFIVRWPAMIAPGRTCAQPVCQVDMFATFADIIKAQYPDSVAEDSYSLLPAFRNEKVDPGFRGPVIHHSSRGYFAIRDGKWKLNMFRGSGGSLKPAFFKPGEGEAPFELYNIEEDPGETTNLYFEYPEIVDSLTTLITSYILEGRSTPGRPQKNDGPEYWKQLTWMKGE